MAGDKVRMLRPRRKTNPKRIGSPGRPEFFAANLNGRNGMIRYGQVYQVSGKDKVQIVDNQAKPLPLIDKEFINHRRFNSLFTAVESPDKTNVNEDKE